MPRQVQISDKLFVNPELVAAIKESSKSSCSVFLSGQSARDGGFLVDRSADDVRADLDGPDLREVAQNLLDALDAAWEPLNDLATWANEQGRPYDGPSFYAATEALRKALGHEVPEE